MKKNKQQKQDLEKEKRRLERERINAEKEYKRFKSNKMYNVLNTIFTYDEKRTKKQTVNSMKTYISDCESKIKKHLFSVNFTVKTMFYQAWKEYAQKQAQEKLFNQYKQEKIKEKVNMERAAYHHRVESCRKYFDSMKKWYFDVKVEKQIQLEHDQKLQLFLENINQRKQQQEMAHQIELKRQQEQIEEGRPEFAIVPEVNTGVSDRQMAADDVQEEED